MAQDLIRYDECKEEVSILLDVIASQDSVNRVQESINLTLRKKNIAYESTIAEYQSIDQFQTNVINLSRAKQKKLRKQRNISIGIGIAAIGAFLIK